MIIQQLFCACLQAHRSEFHSVLWFPVPYLSSLPPYQKTFSHQKTDLKKCCCFFWLLFHYKIKYTSSLSTKDCAQSSSIHTPTLHPPWASYTFQGHGWEECCVWSKMTFILYPKDPYLSLMSHLKDPSSFLSQNSLGSHYALCPTPGFV